jgi:hypothetical protein
MGALSFAGRAAALLRQRPVSATQRKAQALEPWPQLRQKALYSLLLGLIENQVAQLPLHDKARMPGILSIARSYPRVRRGIRAI